MDLVKAKFNFRSYVFGIAHKIVKEHELSLSDALKKAWKAYRLKRDMKKGEVNFTFIKVDGTERKATGTLRNVDHLIKGTDKKKNILTIPFFDLELNAFRSCRIVNII